MAGFKLTTFSGLNKKVSPRLLQDSVAQNAENAFLDSGRLEGLKSRSSADIVQEHTSILRSLHSGKKDHLHQ